MNVSIIEDTKNKLVLSITDESHTLCNAVRKELWTDEHVKAAGYAIEHPLIRNPKFVLETDGAEPRKTLIAALKRLDKSFSKIAEGSKKLNIT